MEEIIKTQIHSVNQLTVKSIGIDTYHENIIYMKEDCPICRSEGYTALTRVVVNFKGKSIIATLNVVYSDLLQYHNAALSKEALKRLDVNEDDVITITYLKPKESLSKMRAKIFKKELDENAYSEIIKDIVSGRYSHIELAALDTACAGNLTVAEIISLTKAMIKCGQKINWNKEIVLDKHCVGGLPGNRHSSELQAIFSRHN